MNYLLVLSAPSRRELAARAAECAAGVAAGDEPLARLARRLALRPLEAHRLALLVEDRDDLAAKTRRALELLRGDRERFNIANRIFSGAGGASGANGGSEASGDERKIAFLFPGFGAQRPNMLGEIYPRLPAVRQWFDGLAPADTARFRRNRLLFSPPGARAWKPERLLREYSFGRITDAVLMANLARHALLVRLGLRCAAMAGHSYGDATVLIAGGMVADYRPVAALLRRISRTPATAGMAAPAPSSLLAVPGAARESLAALLADPAHPVFLALDNCPQQAILCGAAEEMASLEATLQERRQVVFRLPRIQLAVHTPLFPVAPARLREIYADIAVGPPPRVTAYSCATAAPFPSDPDALRQELANAWTSPVRFRETVERLYADGIRTFVEVGPGGHLSGFVRDTLRGTDAVAVAIDREETGTLVQLRVALAHLLSLGHHLDLAAAAGEGVLGDDSAEPTAAARLPAGGETDAHGTDGMQIDGAPADGLADLVARQVAAILGLDDGDGDELDRRRGFFDLGLGSLGSVELAERLAKALGHAVPLTAAFDHPSIERLAGFLDRRFSPPAAQPRAAEPVATGREPIAIVGMACRFPGGAATPEAYWELLQSGGDAIREVPPGRWEELGDLDPAGRRDRRWRQGGFLGEVDRFDAAFFGISPREAVALDPQQRLLLEVSWETLERAALPADALAGSATGVFVGISSGDYAARLTPRQRLAAGGYLATGNAHSTAAGRLSHALGLRGPCVAVDTACSSSLVAVHLACESLRRGESDLALAGGVNLLLSPETSLFLADARALARDGRCKTFDAAADGYVRGEGCGMVALKRWRDAVRDGDDVVAVIRGSAVNHDGATSGLTVPSGAAQQEVVLQALRSGGVAAGEIGYVEAHGTGTALGDPIEVAALGQALGDRDDRGEPIWLGSVKTNIGHLEAAAGIAGLIKVALQLRHRRRAPSLHLTTPTPRIDWARLPFRLCASPTAWTSAAGRPLTAGLSSFGISGTNAHLIVQEPPDAPSDAVRPALAAREAELLVLSARTTEARTALAEAWATHLRDHPEIGLAEAAFTAQLGRSHLPHRLAVVAARREEGLAALAAARPSEREGADGAEGAEGTGRRSPPRLAFLFTGQGAQYAGMGSRLAATEPVFRQALDECDTILRPLLGEALVDLLAADAADGADGGGDGGDGAWLASTAHVQPALFAVEYALVRLWRSWGVQPRALLGHSVGEYVAAWVAGVFGLDDALRLVAARGRLMQSLPAGCGMIAVAAAPREVEEIDLPALGLDVAAVNGPRRVVLSGPAAALATARGRLAARSIPTSALRVSHAFHSRQMDPILEEFRAIAASVRYRPPRLPLFGNLTGSRIGNEALDWPDYWTGQLRRTVRFGDAVRSLRNEGCNLFLEIGPRPQLISLGQECLDGEGADRSAAPPAAWLASLRPPADESTHILGTLGRLYEAGVEVDWHGFRTGRPGRRVALPTYPFQRRRFWIDAGEGGVEDAGSGAPAVATSERRGEAPAGRAWTTLPAAERPAAAAAYLRQVVRDILLYGEGQPLDPRQPLQQLGFDSIMAMRFRHRLRSDLELDVPLIAFLNDEATLDGLAARVLALVPAVAAPPAGASEAGATVAAAGTAEPAPLSYGQRALWFLWRLAPDSTAYNQSLPLRLRGSVEALDEKDAGSWRAACDALLRRHPILRTIYLPPGAPQGSVLEPTQQTQPIAAADWQEVEAGAWSPARLRAELLKAHQEPFDLANGPVARFRWFARAEPILLITLHHIACDGWSLEIIRRDLPRLARRLREGVATRGELGAAPAVTYEDYLRWQRDQLAGPEGERLRAYWRQQLAAPLPVLALPTDRPRPAVQTYRGDSHAVVIPPPLADRLRALAAEEGVTLSTVLLAAFSALLCRYTGQDDLLIGMPHAGRHRADFAAIVGYFVDPLAIRAQPLPGQSFRHLLHAVRATTLAALDHAVMPFALLVETLSPDRDPGRSPLFDVTFNFQGLRTARSADGGDAATRRVESPDDQDDGAGIEGIELPQADGKFDLTLNVVDDAPRLDAALGFNVDLFDRATIARLGACFVRLLEGATARADEPFDRLPLMPCADAAGTAILRGPALTGAADRRLFHRRFEEWAAARPEAPAVRADGVTLSYRELNRRANGLAYHLTAMGVGRDVPVAILAGRSVDPLVGLLAVLKAGGAYLPLDPTAPPDLAAYMVDQARAGAVLASRAQAAAVPATRAPVVWLDAEHFDGDRQDVDPPTRVRRRDLAYVIYTSGSSGRPKGVAVEHRSLANYVASMVRDLGLVAGAHFALASTLAADLGHTMLFPALATGGCLHILGDDVVVDRRAFAEAMDAAAIDYLKIVPSHLAALIGPETTAPRPPLPRRALILGGEAAAPDWVARLMTRAAGCRVFNHYGPTETTVGVLTGEFAPGAPAPSSATLPLRTAVAGAEIHLLDANLQPVPPGVVGELYIGGDCLARGYLHAPELTAASFVRLPLPAAAPADAADDARAGAGTTPRRPGHLRLYRTGDLARQLTGVEIAPVASGAEAAPSPSFAIEILGRRDRQVKLRGYRIELSQVEAALHLSPEVAQCVVLPDADGRAASHLVAYIVTAADSGAGSTSRLRRELETRLPAYMVPQTFVRLDAIPLTANGKVDQRILRELGAAAALAESTRPAGGGVPAGPGEPRDEMELRLTQIWSEVLGVPRIGLQDNFFRLGGHSLLAVRLTGRIDEELQRHVSLATLLTHPTIAELAEVLRRPSTDSAAPGAGDGAPTPGEGLLVPIQRQGSRPPLFCLPGAGGNVLYFHALGRQLAPDQPLWSLQAIGFGEVDSQPAAETGAAGHAGDATSKAPDGGDRHRQARIPDRIEEIASRYLAVLRRQHPPGDGGYRLAGHSFGGLVAFEMARQLAAAGESVALLAVLDNAAPDTASPAAYEGWNDVEWLRHIATRIGKLYGVDLGMSDHDIAALDSGRQLLHLVDRLVASRLLPPDTDRTRFARFVEIYRANAVAAAHYRPQPLPATVRLTLFRATDEDADLHLPANAPTSPPPADATLGWHRYTAQPVEVIAVPGTHLTMTTEPHVHVLAERLRDALARATAESS